MSAIVAVEIRLGPVRRGRAHVLDGWSSLLPAPSVSGVVGLNGAGKSSLMLALGGALRRRAASAEVLRHTTGGGGGAASLALAEQHAALPPRLVLEEICALHAVRADTLFRRYPDLLLDQLAGRMAGTYSGGEAQALCVALALAADADLTLLDEPLAALDVRRRRGLLDALGERRRLRGGGAVLLSSQVATDLHESCDRLSVLAGGRMVFDGPTAALTGAEGAAAGTAETPGAARLEARLLALAAGPLEPPSIPRS